jgi:hypothetical protein
MTSSYTPIPSCRREDEHEELALVVHPAEHPERRLIVVIVANGSEDRMESTILLLQSHIHVQWEGREQHVSP